MDQLKSLAVKVGVDLKKQVVNAYQVLDDISENLAKAYTANYVAWAARPCDQQSIEALRQANARVQHEANVIHLVKNEAANDNPNVSLITALIGQLVQSNTSSQ